jgi:hypothetical protein
MAGLVPAIHVIARSEAAKQSRFLKEELDCFASFAMTGETWMAGTSPAMTSN